MARTARIVELRPTPKLRPVKVVAITGGKGGVGKTSLCANLALSLALMRRRVMVLDGDLGLANINLMFGIQAEATLRNVVLGTHALTDIVVDGPAGVKIVPGSSGFTEMTRLSAPEHAGIVRAFGALERDIDVLLVDTAPGISDCVLQFAGAAHYPLVVVRDEPASITDAYAIIKLLATERGAKELAVVTNQTRHEDGRSLFTKLDRIVNRFLPVALKHAGNVPHDERLARAVKRRQPVVSAFPSSPAALAIKRLAGRIDAWATPTETRGDVEFFVERLMQPGRKAIR
jgi:flagellar biosynthesis protein FlhG